MAVVREAAAAGALRSPFVPEMAPALSKAAAKEASLVEARGLIGVPHDASIRAIVAWTQLFGVVSFELFGRFVDIVDDVSAVFDQAVVEMSAFVGIAPPQGPRNANQQNKARRGRLRRIVGA